MDVAYNQHASVARRKNRSTTNLNHLSLAPLTSKLPLHDHDDIPDALSTPSHSTSYLQGKSAPTTPRLLSRSPGRSRSHTRNASMPSTRLPKSKSATHLVTDLPLSSSHSHHSHHSQPHSGRHTTTTSPTATKRRRDEHHRLSANDHTDSDWLLRAGALISTETRESKGQAWLISRASSTSLAGGLHDAEEEAFERELAHERAELALTAANSSRRTSRRGSLVFIEDENEVFLPSPTSHSRLPSRSQSRAGSRSQMVTPSTDRRSVDGYFAAAHVAGDDDDEYSNIAGPDFVNLNEQLELEAIEQLDTSVDDEVQIRRLVKRGNAGVSAWVGNVLGVHLFPVEEDEEEESDDGEDEEDEAATEGETDDGEDNKRLAPRKKFEGVPAMAEEERMPSPKADAGAWHDAAWLLTVASKVLL
ncbi:hypothetical protein B0T17DRAFT_611936 [Bombardia bombarda]|uniref:Uncharacterized protein n=1 Tax=Bombardia bombarda TaxID=252184 RepID=A0AA39XJD7_9PEZI|nr:hypothetical protein B0T17DRAFT_611936 [Bombardia bombarda]